MLRLGPKQYKNQMYTPVLYFWRVDSTYNMGARNVEATKMTTEFSQSYEN